MKLVAEEPPAGPWRARRLTDVARYLLDQAGDVTGRPVVIAVDGRSASGKTTFTGKLAGLIARSTTVHSDDIAWNHDFFDWDELLADGVPKPVHQGRAVRFRPPPWEERHRAGAVEVPADCTVLIVEGVGVARRSLMPYYDAVVWVQSDLDESRRRGLLRDGSTPADIDFWDEWDAAEVPFQAAEKPWERADLIVAGTPDISYDPATQVVVATGLRPY